MDTSRHVRGPDSTTTFMDGMGAVDLLWWANGRSPAGYRSMRLHLLTYEQTVTFIFLISISNEPRNLKLGMELQVAATM